jgi:uncharacterized protein YbjT (DUF2867 family)
MPVMRTQPIAARSAAQFLVETAVTQRPGEVVEIAGPAPADLISLARAVVRHEGRRVMVWPLRLPGAAGGAMRDGALLPGVGARLMGPTFDEWLATDDAGVVRF